MSAARSAAPSTAALRIGGLITNLAACRRAQNLRLFSLALTSFVLFCLIFFVFFVFLYLYLFFLFFLFFDFSDFRSFDLSIAPERNRRRSTGPTRPAAAPTRLPPGLRHAGLRVLARGKHPSPGYGFWHGKHSSPGLRVTAQAPQDPLPQNRAKGFVR